MRKLLMVLMAVALFAASLTVAMIPTDFNPDAVDTIVSLQAEDADIGDQPVMEKPTGEKPSALIETNFTLLRSTLATSQQEVSAHPGSISPIVI